MRLLLVLAALLIGTLLIQQQWQSTSTTLQALPGATSTSPSPSQQLQQLQQGVEAQLQTAEQQRAERLEKFEKGFNR